MLKVTFAAGCATAAAAFAIVMSAPANAASSDISASVAVTGSTVDVSVHNLSDKTVMCSTFMYTHGDTPNLSAQKYGSNSQSVLLPDSAATYRVRSTDSSTVAAGTYDLYWACSDNFGGDSSTTASYWGTSWPLSSAGSGASATALPVLVKVGSTSALTNSCTGSSC